MAAIAAILTSAISIPALLTSQKAVKIAEQQRLDSVAQRAEDKKERAEEKANADRMRQLAFVSRVQLWSVYSFGGSGWRFRNGNARPAFLHLYWSRPSSPHKGERYSYTLPPCTEGRLSRPKGYEAITGMDSEFVVSNFDANRLNEDKITAWIIGEGQHDDVPTAVKLAEWHSNIEGWPPGEMKITRQSIVPCT